MVTEQQRDGDDNNSEGDKDEGATVTLMATATLTRSSVNKQAKSIFTETLETRHRRLSRRPLGAATRSTGWTLVIALLPPLRTLMGTATSIYTSVVA